MNGTDWGSRSIFDLPEFERNNYFHDKLMTSRDFFAEQCYFNEKRWLINRAVNDWGVVCGLKVVEDENGGPKVKILPGLAIDCRGREMLVRQEIIVEVTPTEADCQDAGASQASEDYYIGLDYWACKTESVQITPAACGESGKHEFNRIKDYYKPCVLRPDEIADDPPQEICPLTAHAEHDLREHVCEQMMESAPACPEKPRNRAVILAKVSLDDQGEIKPIEYCPHRRQVYSNKILADLVNCYHGDMPHVTKISWKQNGETLPLQNFKTEMKKGLWVKFDRKMDASTLNEHTFLLLVKMEDSETGNYRFEQIPGSVKYEPRGLRAFFKINSKWIMDVYMGYSRISHEKSEFIVILKSDYILSAAENGASARALDGNCIGGKLPSGNGFQGGDFMSWFYVRSSKPRPKPGKESDLE